MPYINPESHDFIVLLSNNAASSRLAEEEEVRLITVCCLKEGRHSLSDFLFSARGFRCMMSFVRAMVLGRNAKYEFLEHAESTTIKDVGRQHFVHYCNVWTLHCTDKTEQAEQAHITPQKNGKRHGDLVRNSQA
jgi:hypothetical protein